MTESPGSGEGHRARGEGWTLCRERRGQAKNEWMRMFRQSPQGLGSPYLMASVFAMTGWHLLSQQSQGVETEKADEDLEALMKRRRKGANCGSVDSLSSPEGPAEMGNHELAMEPDRMVMASKILSRGRSRKKKHDGGRLRWQVGDEAGGEPQ